MLMGTFLIVCAWTVEGLPLWMSIINTIIGLVNFALGFYILKGIFRSANTDNSDAENGGQSND